VIALKDGLIEPEHLGLTFQSTARDLTKDPYSFEFLSLTDDYHEKELKDALIDNIEKFLMELGKGFTYVGREYPVDTGGEDYFIDLLFYNIKLHCYVVVEVKTGKLTAEGVGHLAFM
jgi:predicted nuclease of restriction endonuclease-like (RecB) superfamily